MEKSNNLKFRDESKSMDELISVIINVYNGERFIAKCLESIINQTYKNLEILVINDGSTDNTLKICEQYKDERIKIITTENLGLSLSRNVGIENAQGEYLYFVDSDDFVENDVIEYLYNLCKQYNIPFSTCNPLTIFDYDFSVDKIEEHIDIIDSTEMLKKVLLAENVAGAIWNKLFKKELFDGVRFQNRIINDIVVTYKIVMKVDKIVYSNQKKYFYLKHKNAATVSGDERPDRAADFYKASMERYEAVKEIYPNLIENDIGMLRNILRLYLVKNEEVQRFLKEQNAVKYFRKIFSLKMLTSHINFKEKTKLILFEISPKLYKKLGKSYRNSKYEYKY